MNDEMIVCLVCDGTNSLIDVFTPEHKELIKVIEESSNIEVVSMIALNWLLLFLSFQLHNQIKRDDRPHICKSCKQVLEYGYKLRALKKSHVEEKIQIKTEPQEVGNDSDSDEITIVDDMDYSDSDDYSDEEMDEIQSEEDFYGQEVKMERDCSDYDQIIKVWSSYSPIIYKNSIHF